MVTKMITNIFITMGSGRKYYNNKAKTLHTVHTEKWYT